MNYRTMVAPNGTLWGTNVSEGVYEALFNYYPDSKIKPYGTWYFDSEKGR